MPEVKSHWWYLMIEFLQVLIVVECVCEYTHMYTQTHKHTCIKFDLDLILLL